MTVSITKQNIIPKSIMPIIVVESKSQKFRGQIYNQIKQRADSAMDLLDALCSNNRDSSVVQLSLNPLFRRGYSLKSKLCFLCPKSKGVLLAET